MIEPTPQSIRIYNTLTREVERFEPIEPGKVRLYTCGPTVYNFAHIGNLRTYILEDLVRRTFECAGYAVRHVMNVTDVGHLESDADLGEDKMDLAARVQKKSPWDIARFYEDAFFSDCGKLGLQPPHVVCRATEHIGEMIDFISCIESNGACYSEDGNVYFSIDRFPTYGQLAQLDLEQLQAGARIEVDSRKRNSLDFVLWFSNSKYRNHIMQWDSPWGRGFPGWHIECSAMASKYLGERIDIHMGGVDHISVHHTNEIAQSESCLGHQWVNYWMHCDFLIVKKVKMSKSSGDFLRLSTLEDKGFEPVHYRYYCLSAHYRSSLVFTWEALDGARRGFESLRNRVIGWKVESRVPSRVKAAEAALRDEYAGRFWRHVYEDVNVPAALGVAWTMAKDAGLPARVKLELMIDFDRVLGLGVESCERPPIDPDVEQLIRERLEARNTRDWAMSDAIREQLRAERNIQLMDTPDGTEWYFLPRDELAGGD